MPTAANLTKSYLSATYPYSTVGRLTYKDSANKGWACSASVILRGVIVTAAHCVQDFKGAFFTNWQFTPAYYNDGTQTSSLGVWNWDVVARTNSWGNGSDIGSGGAHDDDIAVIILAKNSAGKFVGDVTGKLGYGWNNYSFTSSAQTGNLLVAETATLGYPGLLDKGLIMQQTNGPSFAWTVNGSKQIYQGNPFTAGSSGGPWVVNWRTQSPIYSGGAWSGESPNIDVIGVTSWGASDPNTPNNNYSSQFRQNFACPDSFYGFYGAGNIAGILDAACATVKNGGTKTYEALGYCD